MIFNGQAKLFTEISCCFIFCMIAFVRSIIKQPRHVATRSEITVFLFDVC